LAGVAGSNPRIAVSVFGSGSACSSWLRLRVPPPECVRSALRERRLSQHSVTTFMPTVVGACEVNCFVDEKDFDGCFEYGSENMLFDIRSNGRS
jgi:hypothetical protein